MITRLGRTSDSADILALQERNLFANLSEADRGDGFVTTIFTPTLIQEFVAIDGVFVAEHADRVVGYAFGGPWSMYDRWPIFPVMTANFPTLWFDHQPLNRETSFQYGPICLDRSVRGSGLLPQLFATVCAAFTPLIGTTFINRRNARSMRAHTRTLGLTVVDHFEFNDQSYAILAFSTQPKAR